MMEPEPCPETWPTLKPISSSASVSQLALFQASASGATTPASSQIPALDAGCSSASHHQAAQTSSVIDPSPSHPRWSAAPLPSSPLSKSRPLLDELRRLSGTSSITSDAQVVSPPSSAPLKKRCELQQNPSEASEDLLRYFRKLAEWFPEPTDDEVKCVGLRGVSQTQSLSLQRQ